MTDSEIATVGAKQGFFARLFSRLRMRIRRIFRKDDPNIYPFF